MDTFTVKVRDEILVYPNLSADYAQHIAEGGVVGSFYAVWRKVREGEYGPYVMAVHGWVWLDESPLAYFVKIYADGTHEVIGAALPEGAEERELYVA